MSSRESRRIRLITTNAFGPETGCADGGCIFGHPGGMQTNGGCECLKGNATELRRNLQKLARIARIARLALGCGREES